MAQAEKSGAISEACRTNSWVAAIVIGVLAFLLAWKAFGFTVIMALIPGIILFFLVGYVLVTHVCPASAHAASTEVLKSTPAPSPEQAPAEPEAAMAEAAVAPTKVETAPAEKTLAEEKPAKPAAAKKAKAAPKKAVKTAKKAAKPAAKKTAKLSGPVAPAPLGAARGGKADDLKMIKGVGPGLEKTLNGMGIFHVDQIAGWSPDELAYMDANMPRFKGRASRDGWIDQAKKLAAGESTEFSARVKKGDVY